MDKNIFPSTSSPQQVSRDRAPSFSFRMSVNPSITSSVDMGSFCRNYMWCLMVLEQILHKLFVQLPLLSVKSAMFKGDWGSPLVECHCWDRHVLLLRYSWPHSSKHTSLSLLDFPRRSVVIWNWLPKKAFPWLYLASHCLLLSILFAITICDLPLPPTGAFFKGVLQDDIQIFIQLGPSAISCWW